MCFYINKQFNKPNQVILNESVEVEMLQCTLVDFSFRPLLRCRVTGLTVLLKGTLTGRAAPGSHQSSCTWEMT